MTDINSLVIVGRLTRDCGSDPNGRDFTYTQGGMCIARVSIAVNRSQKQNGQWVDVANFFDVTIFGKTAENLKPYFVKGRQIVVSGHLQQERWKDQNGQNKSKISIIADDVQLAGGGNNNASQYNPQTVYPTAQAAQMASAQANPQQYAPPQNQPQQYQQIPQNQPQYPQQGQSMQNSQGNFPPPCDNGFPEDVPW
jgi:single-strand DNA-binding protein